MTANCAYYLQENQVVQNMTKDERPIGFAMALAMNPEAMQKFASLNEAQKQEIIAGTHAIYSTAELRRYVVSLVNDK